MNEPFPLLTFSTLVLPCHRLYVVAWNWVSRQGFAIGLTYVAFKKNKKKLFCVFSGCWRKLQQGSEPVGIPLQEAGCRKDLFESNGKGLNSVMWNRFKSLC